MGNFNKEYFDLLAQFTYSNIELNARTNTRIKALSGARSLGVDLSTNRLPVPGNRKYYPSTAAAETAWQFMGTKSTEFISKHAPKMWNKFIRSGELETAYGYRWREHFFRDQISLAIEVLKTDPTNRQIYISAWDPSTDGLGGEQPPNIPCPVGFSLNCVNGRLHCAVFCRSTDVFVGLPYDIMCYALTVDAIATSCSLKLGSLHFTLAHAHLYEPHFKMCTQSIDMGRDWIVCKPFLPNWSVEEILQKPEKYLEHINWLSKWAIHSVWTPKVEVVV